mgnify:CR=1 FL=1
MTAISIRHLRYFDALVRHGHFGRAADASAVTQPALSVQIRQLEDILGGPLVERGARSIRLTRLGQAIAERAADILRAVDDLADFARASRMALSGALRIGIIPTVAPYFLAAAVKALGEAHGALEVRPREAVTRTLIDELVGGRLDIAIVALPVSEPSLTEAALFTERFVLVRPLEEAGQPVPSAKALGGMKLLLLEEGHCFRDQALAFCDMAAGPQPNLVEGSSLSTLVQLVGAGIGMTLIPQMAVAVETRSAAVAVAHFPEPGPSRTIGVVWRRSNPLGEQFAAMAAILRDAGPAP